MAANQTFVETLVISTFEGLGALVRLFKKETYSYQIMVIFKRLKICVETLEHKDPVKEYPVLVEVSPDRTNYFYKLPLGLTFKQVQDNLNAFETAFKPKKVEIKELRDSTKAHFSISIKERINP